MGNRKWLISAALVFVFCFALPLASRAQDGEISGNVWVAGSNQPPEGTVITLSSDAGEIIQQVTPQGGGRFQFSYLRRGVYYVTVRAPGYHDGTQRADLFTIKRMSLFFTMVSKREKGAPQPPAEEAVVDERQLRIPEKARKEFERGARDVIGERPNPESGLKHLRKAVELYPEYYEAYSLMGTAYMDLQKWPEAEEALRHSLKLNDRYAASYFALGAMYNRQSKPAEAAELLEKGLEIDANGWSGHLELAQSCLSLNQVQKAEDHARRAHELAPKFALVHVVLANTLLRRQDLKAARQEYQHYLDSAPQGPLAGQVRTVMDRIDTALKNGPAPRPQNP
ncbi:MAG TPA: tetratricopeptide repeat protein [Candidatus Xenobia bacterium]|nr:tetratricopeptide repeat protein [Candidatus Xenobia bacterium]